MQFDVGGSSFVVHEEEGETEEDEEREQSLSP
jgi:hypothetical protein